MDPGSLRLYNSVLASYLTFIKSGYNYFQHLVLDAFHIVYLFFIYLVNRNQPSYTLDYFEIAFSFLLTWWTYYQFFDTMRGAQELLLTAVNYLLFILFMMVSTLRLFLHSEPFH